MVVVSSAALLANNAAAISLYTVSAVIIMDLDGSRLLAKYYGLDSDSNDLANSLKRQQAFERVLHERTRKQALEVVMLDGYVAVYRTNMDITVFVVGKSSGNELMLATVLDTIFETFTDILKPQVDKHAMLESYDSVALVIDEAVDCGVVLESDSKDLTAKITRRSDSTSISDIPLSEQGFSAAFNLAKQQLARSLLK